MKNLKAAKSGKCACGKTKDPNGNCDGSHADANRNRYVKKIISAVLMGLTFLSFQSFANTLDGEVKVKDAKIVWKGFKVTGAHEGLISLESGALIFDEDELVGGNFTVDMTSLTCTDLSGVYKSKLEGHLTSADFFDTEQYKESTLNITEVSKINATSYNVKADLSIKGQTEKVEFVSSFYGKKATSSMKIDRTLFGIEYGSGSVFKSLGDKMIYDEFELIIDLNF